MQLHLIRLIPLGIFGVLSTWSINAYGQVRVEPKASTHEAKTWASALAPPFASPSSDPPTEKNKGIESSCPFAVEAPDSVALVGGGEGFGVDIWSAGNLFGTKSIRWTSVPMISVVTDTLRAAVVNIDCDGPSGPYLNPIRIIVRNGSRYLRVSLISQVEEGESSDMLTEAGNRTALLVIKRTHDTSPGIVRAKLGDATTRQLVSLDEVVAAKKAAERAQEDSEHVAREKRIAQFPPGIRKLIREGKVRLGMTGAQVRESWGSPDRVNRTIMHHRTDEQWVYGSGDAYLYFEDGILVTIQD